MCPGPSKPTLAGLKPVAIKPCIGAALIELREAITTAALGSFPWLGVGDGAPDVLLFKMAATGAAPTAAPTGDPFDVREHVPIHLVGADVPDGLLVGSNLSR